MNLRQEEDQTVQETPQTLAAVDERVTALRGTVEANAAEATRRTDLTNSRLGRHETDHTRHPGHHDFVLGTITPTQAQIFGAGMMGAVLGGVLVAIGSQVRLPILLYAMFGVSAVLAAIVAHLWISIEYLQREITRLAESHRPTGPADAGAHR